MKIAALPGKLLLLVVSLAVTLTAVDALVHLTDLDFRAIRSRANDDSMLERSEFRTRVVTNALGFREPRLPSPKPAGTRRIVAIGDSFTQGYGVEEHEAYPRRLEGLLERAEVINLGVPGACPLDYVAHVEEVGLEYEPDLVLVGIMANDVNDIRSIRELGGRILPSVLHQEQDRLADVRPIWKRLASRLWPALYPFASELARGLGGPESNAHAAEQAAAEPTWSPKVPAERWKEVLLAVAARYDNVDEVERRLATLSPEQLEAIRPVLTGAFRLDTDEQQHPMLALMALVQPHVYSEMVLPSAMLDEAWDETMRHLRRIDALARGSGARTMIVYIPSGLQVTRRSVEALERMGFEPDPRTLTDTTLVDRLRAFGDEAGIPVVDLLAPLRARASEDLYFPVDGHWTPRGHRVAAEVLARAIEESPG